MNGKWNHSTKPSTYNLLDNDGNIVYSGSFKDCMEQHKKINSIVDGYDAGYEDAERTLLSKLDAIIADAEIASKLYDSVETAEAFYTLKNVRRTLFGKYIDEE